MSVFDDLKFVTVILLRVAHNSTSSFGPSFSVTVPCGETHTVLNILHARWHTREQGVKNIGVSAFDFP